MDNDSRACPLRFTCFIGNDKTVYALLYNGYWSKDVINVINKGFVLACTNKHGKVVMLMIIDGRASLFYENSKALTFAAHQTKHIIVDILVEKSYKVEYIKRALVWNIHLDQMKILKIVDKYDKSICSNRFLLSAIHSKSSNFTNFILDNKYYWNTSYFNS